MFRVYGLDRFNIEDYIGGVAVGAIKRDTRSLDSSLYGRCSKILASFWNAMMLGHSDSQYTYLGHNEKRRNDLVGVGLCCVVLLRYDKLQKTQATNEEHTCSISPQEIFEGRIVG